MKKLFLSLFFAVLATTGLYAQQISVVSSGGATSLYRTLQEAIDGADSGSVIYLPGGTFPINPDYDITKKLTIIGIGHNSYSEENVDGCTVINGNLRFADSTNGSSVMGCYITGYVMIGASNATVNDFLLKHCNIGELHVHASCMGTVINQNYIRAGSFINGSSDIVFAYNICGAINDISGGSINNNIIVHGLSPFYNINNTIVKDNIIICTGNETATYASFDNNQVSGNIRKIDWSADPNLIKIDDEWTDVFVNFNGGAISPVSDFHFKEAYKQYENQAGVYAGGVDFDKQLAPVPYIVAKRVDTETDASGKLNVKIRVKAGQ